MKGGNFPSKTVLHLSVTVPTAVLTCGFGVDAFHFVSPAFGLRKVTDRKRDLYLIANVRYGMIIAYTPLFVNFFVSFLLTFYVFSSL